MWRWLSSIRGAIRQHIHGPRASATGVYVEEEKEQLKEEQQQQNENNCHRAKFREDDGKNKGPDREWWFRDTRCNFWSYLNSHNTLEAIGWGAAVVLGIQLSKQHPKWFDRNDTGRPTSRCLLYRVAYSLPGQTKRSVVDSNNVHYIVKDSDENFDSSASKQDDQEKKEKDDLLSKVMTEFQNVCKKYTGVAKNMEGYSESRRGNMSKAFSSWSEGSQLGYAKAQFNLGLCYETGQGVPKNVKEAVKCYTLAAQDGHAQAQYNLALLYLEGEGVEQNTKYAITLLEKAAKAGLTKAQMYLGVHYTEEESRDMEQAILMFTEASRQNEPEAQYFLGICHEQGWGVDVNECKAAELYSLAASGGHDGAMYNLAVFHEQGLGGLPVDKVSAIDMYRKAADLGNEQAQQRLEDIDDSYPKKWKQEYPSCKMNDLYTDLAQFDSSEEKPQEESVRPIMKEGKQQKLSSSPNSSPSLTDYVRQHLQEITINKDSVDLLTSNQMLLTGVKNPMSRSNGIIPPWQRQYSSPKVPSSNATQVLFSLGGDEDDINNLESLHSSTEQLNWNFPGTDKLGLCSMVHRTSTMPDLQAVPCS